MIFFLAIESNKNYQRKESGFPRSEIDLVRKQSTDVNDARALPQSFMSLYSEVVGYV